MVGGRIGKDGIHGATFSSAELTESSPVQAVQIGDPITQKMMFDFLLEARDQGLYSSITDNGAGGLSSSVGEMAQPDRRRAARPREGAAQVPGAGAVGDPGLRGAGADDAGRPARRSSRRSSPSRGSARWRRPTSASSPPSPRSRCSTGDRTVALLPMEFLHDGDPELRARRRVDRRSSRPAIQAKAMPATPEEGNALARDFLARDNLRSSEERCRSYDHEVKGLTVVKPWIGVHRDVPSDASVLMIAARRRPDRLRARRGGLPDLLRRRRARDGAGRRRPRRPARHRRRRPDRPDRRARQLLLARPAGGAQQPRRPAEDGGARPRLPRPLRDLRRLRRPARQRQGLDEERRGDRREADSRSRPTLLASAIAVVPDVRKALTLEASEAGQLLYMVGDTRDELGCTEWAAARGVTGGEVPRCLPEPFFERYAAVAWLIQEGLVVAAHAPGRGGLLPSLFYMARAAGLGLAVELANVPRQGKVGWEGLLFGESTGRLLLAVQPGKAMAVEKRLAGLPVAQIGAFDDGDRLRIWLGGHGLRGRRSRPRSRRPGSAKGGSREAPGASPRSRRASASTARRRRRRRSGWSAPRWTSST